MLRLSTLLHFIFPGGVLFAGSAVILYTGVWNTIDSSQVDLVGAIILSFGFFLAWRFDRNRVLYALLLLLAADIADRWFLPTPDRPTLHGIIAILLPFNFVLIGLMKEKGVRSVYGIVQTALLPLQAALVYFWLTHWQAAYSGILDFAHVKTPVYRIPDAFLFLFVLALTVQMVRYFRYRSPLESAFIWLILLSSIAGVMPPGHDATLFRLTAALVMILSILEMSHALAYRDELTGLPGRRALHEAFRKLGGQFTIAIADIDHFKKLNDTFGHDIGDQVLRMVAARLARCGPGTAFRYGGEEFCLVFSGQGRDAVLEQLEKLRSSVADQPFTIRQVLRPVKKPKQPKKKGATRKTIRVTVSIGVAEKSGRAQTGEAVMKAADQALYRAKKGGRNRVCK